MEWLDLLLDFVQAHRMYAKIEHVVGPFLRDVSTVVYPRVVDTERHDRRFDSLQALTNADQHHQMATYGYAKMNAKQLRIAYSRNGEHARDSDTRALVESKSSTCYDCRYFWRYRANPKTQI